jgi:hypothetical protein
LFVRVGFRFVARSSVMRKSLTSSIVPAGDDANVYIVVMETLSTPRASSTGNGVSCHVCAQLHRHAAPAVTTLFAT